MSTQTEVRASRTEMITAIVIVVVAAALTPLLPWLPPAISALLAAAAFSRHRRHKNTGWLVLTIAAAALLIAGLLLNLGWFLVQDTLTGTNVEPAASN